jgi:hypothetical protein
MQFGRIYGIALIILGVILIGVQLDFALGSRGNVPPRGQPSGASVQPHDVHRLGPLDGIIGTASLIAGIAVFSSARRGDQPHPSRRVRQSLSPACDSPA